MNKREAAIISAYTQIMMGNFEDLIIYAEEVLRREVLPEEFLDNRFKDDLCCIAAYDFFKLSHNLMEE